MTEEQNKQPQEQAKQPAEQSVQPQEQKQQAPAQNKDNLWAMFTHLSALASLLIWIPGANILGPLIIWLIKKNEIAAVNTAGKQALNFQIWMTIYVVAALITVVGMFLIPVIGIVNLIFVIIASVKTNNGESFTYPLVPYKFFK